MTKVSETCFTPTKMEQEDTIPVIILDLTKKDQGGAAVVGYVSKTAKRQNGSPILLLENGVHSHTLKCEKEDRKRKKRYFALKLNEVL